MLIGNLKSFKIFKFWSLYTCIWICAMHWSRNWSCTDHVADHTLITWLIMHWSRVYHALLTWLILHWSRAWSCTDHVTNHELITWLNIHWSRDWSCTDHVTDHALITWLSCTDHVAIRHWSRDCAWTDDIPVHALTTWLIIHWSRAWSCPHHVAEYALITKLIWPRDCACTDHLAIMHWSRGYHALITCLVMHRSRD